MFDCKEIEIQEIHFKAKWNTKLRFIKFIYVVLYHCHHLLKPP